MGRKAISANSELQESLSASIDRRFLFTFAGEEFNEFGRFAHSYSFNNFQTSTPFIMHIPGKKNDLYDITSHADIMPTIMDYINLSEPFNKIFSGKSLIRYNELNDYAIIQECQIDERPKKFIIADKKSKMEFRLSGNKIESGKLTTINDEPSISTSPEISNVVAVIIPTP